MQVRQKNRWEKENNPKLLVGSAATQHVQVESRPGSIRALSLDEAFWPSFSSGENVQNPEQKEKKEKAAHSGVKKCLRVYQPIVVLQRNGACLQSLAREEIGI